MTHLLPSVTPSELLIGFENPEAFISDYISKLSPKTEFIGVRAIAIEGFFGDILFFFELLNIDYWLGEYVEFRTGETMVRFNADGKPIRMRWTREALFDDSCNLPARPLWLPHHFWDAIPLDDKLSDPDYREDPFDGAADFQPVRKDSAKGGL